MRFWARAGSLALASVAAACAFGQSFGTFGFDPYPVVPGFKISSEGFVVDESAADVFRFAVPLRSVRLTSITDRTAAWETDADLRSPQGFEANLRSPGFVMRVRERFRLRLRSLGRPVLTVDIATYDGAPTPTTTWVLCSLPDGQPPILFSFLDGISDARVTGAPGDWTLQFGAAYSGRIRVALPFGQRPYRPDLTSAARFGAAARELRSRKFWTSAPPRSIGYTAESVPGGLITRWTFDRPGAMVPTTALLASRLSGVRIESPYDLLTESFAEGPFGVATGPELAIRWPVPQRVRGKAVTWGAPFGPALAAEEQIWLAAADDSVREAALAAVHRRYAELPRFRLPVSGSTAPGSLTPEGLQTLARLAWDHQALLTVLDRPSGANLALTVLLWTMNHRTYA
ncbi:MAG: hypothetical protein MH204_02705, partial [Fimbriimonadaceae bacterium]|nr:hypothetical protein [Fimbriimonadaceae bacterium]